MDNIVIAEPVEPTEEAPVSEEVESETTAEEEETEETTEEVAEEVKPKATAQERIQELINQRNQERAEFERRFAEIEQKVVRPPIEVPDFIEITPQVNAQVNQALAEYDRLRVEAELEGDYLKAVQYKGQFDTILAGLNENQKRAQAAQEAKSQQEQQSKLVSERAYNAEVLRQKVGIPKEDWQRAGEWFSEEASKDPVIGIQFSEIEARQGTMAAINYAYSVVKERMGKPVEAAIQKKETTKPVSLTSTRTVPSNDLRGDLDTDEWMRRRKKQLLRTG